MGLCWSSSNASAKSDKKKFDEEEEPVDLLEDPALLEANNTAAILQKFNCTLSRVTCALHFSTTALD